jgi:hypothetical protein
MVTGVPVFAYLLAPQTQYIGLSLLSLLVSFMIVRASSVAENLGFLDLEPEALFGDLNTRLFPPALGDASNGSGIWSSFLGTSGWVSSASELIGP